MSWNKSIFSYVAWFVYTALTGAVLARTAGVFCVRAGINARWGILSAAILLLAAGNIVFLIGRHREGLAALAKRNRRALGVLEAAAVTVLLAIGTVIRAEGAADALQSSVYFDMARVAEGQRIPQMAHGAAYYYVGLLHGVLMLIGNHFQAGIWLQIVLQLAGFSLLYFVIRKQADTVTAMVVLGLCTCGSYMVESALVLSPEPLFFLIFTAVAALAAAGAGGRRNPALFFLLGIPIAFCCYLDIMGGMLLFFAVTAVFSGGREEQGKGRKAAAVFFCVSGTVLGFFMTVCIDALISGKKLGGVLQAWWLLYRPEGFRLPAVLAPAGEGTEGAAIVALLAFGVFSFWCDRKQERMSVLTMSVLCIAAAACLGMFTEEMPGFYGLYLSLAALAGIGIGQCFKVPESVPEGGGKAAGEALQGTETQDCPTAVLAPELSSERDPQDAPEIHKGGKMAEQEEISVQGSRTETEKQVRYIENPLPLPKKHEKRVLDFPAGATGEQDDFDYPVSDEDDFDI